MARIAGLIIGMILLLIIGTYAVNALNAAGQQSQHCGVIAKLAADVSEGAMDFC
ncbi:MAG: hypothetical protein ABEJ99_05830 [Candidatus Nanohaloarchaea archaeon]